MKEIFPNCGYYITKDGKIISKRFRKGKAKKELSPFVTNSGYKAIILRIDGVAKSYYIHRLVATTFLPNPYGKPEVNHKDMNKMNNTVENLEWVTPSENNNHFRNNSANDKGITSGQRGILYQGTKKIKEFRSLQQAKLYCKEVFNCTLSTIGDKNVNWYNNLIYLRNKSSKSIEDVITELKIERKASLIQIKKYNQATKGISGTVYKNGEYINHFNSIRAANISLQCDFKKKDNCYKARDLIFIPDK